MKQYLLIIAGVLYTAISFAQTWQDVGSPGFSSNYSYYQVMEFDDETPAVAYKDWGESEQLVVSEFNGVSWEKVGSNVSPDNIDYLSFAINNGTKYVAFNDVDSNSRLTVRKFDGANWVNVGTPGFSANGIIQPSIAFDEDTLYVAYSDNVDFITVQKFDGTDWSVYATNLTNWDVGYLKLKFSNGTPYILYHEYEGNTHLPRVLTSDGQSWTHLPDPTSASTGTGTKDLEIFNGIPFVTVVENVGNDWFLNVRSFNTTLNTWTLIGGNVTDSSVNHISMTIDEGIPYVAYKELSTSKLVVRKLNGVSWDLVGAINRESFDTEIRIDPTSSQPMVAFSDAQNGEKTSVILFEDATSTESISLAPLSVFPNPTKSSLNIAGEFNRGVLYNALGEEILHVSEGSPQVDLSHLESGVYMLTLITESGNYINRIVKE